MFGEEEGNGVFEGRGRGGDAGVRAEVGEDVNHAELASDGGGGGIRAFSVGYDADERVTA